MSSFLKFISKLFFSTLWNAVKLFPPLLLMGIMGNILLGAPFELISDFVGKYYFQLVFGYTIIKKSTKKISSQQLKTVTGYKKIKNYFQHRKKIKQMSPTEKMHYDYIRKIDTKLNKLKHELTKINDQQIKEKINNIISNTNNILDLYYKNNQTIDNRVALKNSLSSTENILEQFIILASYSQVEESQRNKVIASLDKINQYIKSIMNSNLEDTELQLEVEMDVLNSELSNIDLLE